MDNSNYPYDGLAPFAVWRHFAGLNAIPRVSGNEAAALDYVIAAAERSNAPWKRDAYGNVLVSVPGSIADAPVVALQSHLDMVPATAEGVRHNWATDPIVPRIVDGKVYGSGTTLGADNGIGAAMALAMLDDSTVEHGPLELLFTVEEEVGLRGASALDPALLTAKYMVNLDSEEIEKLTIGCTGGATLQIDLDAIRETAPDGLIAYSITVDGALGGHSGIEIDKPRANAIRLLGNILNDLPASSLLASIEGGSAANAIPKSARAIVLLDRAGADALPELLRTSQAQIIADWHLGDPNIRVTASPTEKPANVFDRDTAANIIELITLLPHGVLAWSKAYGGKPETSMNVAVLQSTGSAIHLVVSVRSFIAASLAAEKTAIPRMAEKSGGVVTLVSEYPGWEPSSRSTLLAITEEAYRATYGTEPVIEVVHAGLECGAILSKLPDLEAVSFGPNIGGAHTPDEHVEIATVESTWRLLVALLGRLATEK